MLLAGIALLRDEIFNGHLQANSVGTSVQYSDSLFTSATAYLVRIFLSWIIRLYILRGSSWVCDNAMTIHNARQAILIAPRISPRLEYDLLLLPVTA